MTPPPPDFLTVDEVAAMLRVSGMTVRRRIDDGTLPAYKIGETTAAPLRIDRRDLYTYLRRVRSGR